MLAAVSITIVLLIGLTVTSVVKVNTYAPELPDIQPVEFDYHFQPNPGYFDLLNHRLEWTDKKIDGRAIPMLKSVPLIERNGKVYDLSKPVPQLFASLPNQWLVDHHLDFLDSRLPSTDPDHDLFTVLEEYQAGTDPKDPASHPELHHLLTYLKHHYQLYRLVMRRGLMKKRCNW